MAAFYGTLKGSRGRATKTGTKNSGITASVQSWGGSVITNLVNVKDEVLVTIDIAEGSDMFGKTYFYGTLEELKAKLA